ncbi:MAG: hypothetical protein RL150_381 [Candidatus Parcubacteria bacterium]|jgi:hypothetical protein
MEKLIVMALFARGGFSEQLVTQFGQIIFSWNISRSRRKEVFLTGEVVGGDYMTNARDRGPELLPMAKFEADIPRACMQGPEAFTKSVTHLMTAHLACARFSAGGTVRVGPQLGGVSFGGIRPVLVQATFLGQTIVLMPDKPEEAPGSPNEKPASAEAEQPNGESPIDTNNPVVRNILTVPGG